MSQWLLAISAVLMATEIAVRAPLQAIMTTNLRTANKAVAVIASRRISEHWKEVVLLRYARTLFVGTGRLSLALAAVAAPLILWGWLSTGAPPNLGPLQWRGALVATLVAVVWAPIRGRLVKR